MNRLLNRSLNSQKSIVSLIKNYLFTFIKSQSFITISRRYYRKKKMDPPET